MKSISIKNLYIDKFLIIIFLFFINSCADDEIKPFVGEKLNLHENVKLKINSKLNVRINNIIFNEIWPQKGGDQGHSISNTSFQFPLKNIFKKNVQEESTDNYPRLTEPVSDINDIFVLNTNGKILSISKSNLVVNWESRIFEEKSLFSNPGSIVVQNKGLNLYVHNGSNVITSVNKKNGKINWKYTNKFPFRGNISLKENNVVVNDYNNNLLVFFNDKLKWTKKLGQNNNTIFSSIRPIIYKNMIINPAHNGLFHILNIDTGKLIFSDYLEPNKNKTSILLNNDIVANPITYREKLYIMSHSGTLSAYDLNKFKIIWSTQIGSTNTPIISGDNLFVIDNEGQLIALDRSNGEIIWKKHFKTNIEQGLYFKNKKRISYLGPFLIGNKLILFTNEGLLKLIDPLDGKLLRSINFEVLGTNPIFVDSKLITLTSDGNLKIYK